MRAAWACRISKTTAAEAERLILDSMTRDPNPKNEVVEAVNKVFDAALDPRAFGFKPRFEAPKKWPEPNPEQIEAVVASTGGLADLWEHSPIRFEDADPHTEEIIDRLFPGNPLLCCGASNSNFATRSREDWRGSLSGLQLIVPSPMSALTGKTKTGRTSAHTLDNTGPRRFLVVEQDNGTADDQAGVLLHLASKGPLVLAVHSGSKSIHGWFHHNGQPEESLRSFMRHAVEIGADPATWTRSQFVRMPDGTRQTGARQAVYYFNPEVITR